MRRREFLGTVAAQAAAGTLQRFDVVVVGAGVFGACTAHLLRKSGKKVALLDAYGAGNSRASSGGESRIIRMGYGKAEVYTRWSHASLGWWRDFFKRTGHPLFHQTGVLWMSHADDVRTRESRATLERLRIPFEAIAEAELARRYPQIRFPGMIGTLEPESGALAARQAVQAVVADAVRNGCEYIPDAVAQPRGKGKLDTVATNSGRKIPANVFVFACGPWLGKLFPDLLGNRIFPSRQEVFFFGIPAGDRRFAPPALPVWIDFSIPA
ncbi:MAG TPA: FAD-dependent oxidoreductase, partial [Bryobacteraceae bacterium]|nr:FAD-dependent oxidoreductase [Bryobacteraceae bacterium]